MRIRYDPNADTFSSSGPNPVSIALYMDVQVRGAVTRGLRLRQKEK